VAYRLGAPLGKVEDDAPEFVAVGLEPANLKPLGRSLAVELEHQDLLAGVGSKQLAGHQRQAQKQAHVG
jgi:hypothetical protein